ncbi:MAG: type II toxin-antitoxin system RelE/ParE family toxin [Planctomycetota bacterium]
MAGRSRRVVWSERARDGLDDALGYIAEDSPTAAGKVLDVALRTASSLSDLSERGRIVPELQQTDIREVFVFSYRMLYEVTDSEVRILAFLHGARDFAGWWRGV